MGHPFEHSLPGRTHARAVHICVYVNGCPPEFHPVPVMRRTWVTPPDLVLIGRTNTALWPAEPKVGKGPTSAPVHFLPGSFAKGTGPMGNMVADGGLSDPGHVGPFSGAGSRYSALGASPYYPRGPRMVPHFAPNMMFCSLLTDCIVFFEFSRMLCLPFVQYSRRAGVLLR